MQQCVLHNRRLHAMHFHEAGRAFGELHQLSALHSGAKSAAISSTGQDGWRTFVSHDLPNALMPLLLHKKSMSLWYICGALKSVSTGGDERLFNSLVYLQPHHNQWQ
jgi:hypothetical protein